MKFIDASKLKKDSTFYLAKEMSIAEIMEKSPKAVELLSLYGLHCATCFASNFDTLKEGATVHGIDDQELEEMIEEINIELANENNHVKK
jgi:hybrid cluster-associated redox disulfide protein